MFFTEFKIPNSFTLECSFFKKYNDKEIEYIQSLKKEMSLVRRQDAPINRKGIQNKSQNNMNNITNLSTSTKSRGFEREETMAAISLSESPSKDDTILSKQPSKDNEIRILSACE